MSEDDFCYLTTDGRISGEPHEIEIWYEIDPVAPATVFLLAGAGHGSDWVRNLVHHPAATLRFGTDPDVQRVQARILDDDTDESRRARDLVYAKYQPRGHGDLASWRDRSLPVALDLTVSG
jgi:deazaflavin-dependent oxidoreductase (nitroreductase family)